MNIFLRLAETSLPNEAGEHQGISSGREPCKTFCFAWHFGVFLINHVVKAMWSQRHGKQTKKKRLQNKNIQCAKTSKETNKHNEWGKAVKQKTGEQRQKMMTLLHSIPNYLPTGIWKKKNQTNYNSLRELSCPSTSLPQWYTFSSDSSWLHHSFMLVGDLFYLMVCWVP